MAPFGTLLVAVVAVVVVVVAVVLLFHTKPGPANSGPQLHPEMMEALFVSLPLLASLCLVGAGIHGNAGALVPHLLPTPHATQGGVQMEEVLVAAVSGAASDTTVASSLLVHASSGASAVASMLSLHGLPL